MVYPARAENVFLFKLSTANSYLTFRKAREFLPFHSAAKLSKSACFECTLWINFAFWYYFLQISFITICKSQKKIPNKLLMPCNCTLLFFHSSPWYSKAAFSFYNVIAIQKLNSLLFCNVALKAFYHLFRKAFTHLLEISKGVSVSLLGKQMIQFIDFGRYFQNNSLMFKSLIVGLKTKNYLLKTIATLKYSLE